MNLYKLQPEAEKDLEEIWQYTAQKWSVEQANKYVDTLDTAFQNLAEMPSLCRERQEFNPPVQIYHCEHHLIAYTMSDKKIIIIRVLHENMDIERHLEKEKNNERER